ncbi:MAG: PAS domain S-box protein [Nitrospira sp.]|nr:PAS domain S-box protein [Nitrospira sp.]
MGSRLFLWSRPDPSAGGPEDRGRENDAERSAGRRWPQVLLAVCAHYAQRGGLFEGALIALMLGLFVLDLELPLGAAPEFLYAAVVYFSLWSLRTRFPVLVTVGCTGLTIAGFMLSSVGTAAWIDLANRFFAVVLLWITLELGLTRREAHQALQESHAVLEVRVRQRTVDLSHAVESLEAELVQRRQAERLLDESRERYRLLFDHAPYPMWIVDLDTLAFLDVNETAVRHYGYSRDEFLGMTAKDIRPPEDVPQFLEAVPLAQDSLRIEGVWRHCKKDGSIIDVEIGLYSFMSNGRRARLAVVNDVTESRRMTTQLRESEERFRRIFDSAPIGMGLVGPDGRFMRVNDAFCSMVGYSPAELASKTFSDITHPQDAAADRRLAEQVFTGKLQAYQLEKQYLTKTGKAIWGHLTVSGLLDGGGGARYALGMVKDISERKRAEATKNQWVARIIAAQEEERRRIACELHDGIGQILTSLAVGLCSIEGEGCVESTVPRMRILRQTASTAVEDLRRIARGLRPSVLDDLGLYEALRQYAREYGLTQGIAVDLYIQGEEQPRPPGPVETALYRIVQEAMTNVMKHSAARHVGVVLNCGPSTISLVVEDDGCGFDAAGSKSAAGIGIASMRERAALLRGTVEIESLPGKGTAVYVRLPLKGGQS